MGRKSIHDTHYFNIMSQYINITKKGVAYNPIAKYFCIYTINSIYKFFENSYNKGHSLLKT